MTKRICDLCGREVGEFDGAGTLYLEVGRIVDFCAACNAKATRARSETKEEAKGFENELYIKKLGLKSDDPRIIEEKHESE